ncbi:cytochrome P450 [Streptomyces sp. NPDC048248]|uniref:cytochrome P450 n=1 Tax=Streptomyces sp. NPDC048248 TaxID=3365523 RepID=UPI00371EBB70
MRDVRSVLRDPRFSADASRPGFPCLTVGRTTNTTHRRTFMQMDPPQHTAQRRLLTADFMAERIECLRGPIQQHTDELLDRMTHGKQGADLVTEFALPLPSLIICLLLGVPYDDHEFFQKRSATMLRYGASTSAMATARNELISYLEQLTAAKAGTPDDSIISQLMTRGVSAEQIASMTRLLIIAGHETTANMTALSVLALLRHPAQLSAFRTAADSGETSAVRPAVEELLRYLTIVQSGLPRLAVEDVTVADTRIRAGEGVLCMLSAANRDEHVFPDGHVLDIGRDRPRHVAFGFGVHQCLGQSLARVELEIALATVICRLPHLRLAVPFESIRFHTDKLVHGVQELPVTWSALT